MWYQLPTVREIFKLIKRLAIFAITVGIITTLSASSQASAAPGINKTLNFQGRLLSSNGSVVPDGYYNMQFKLYQGGNGSTAGNPSGELKWTENYTNNGGQAGVRVQNGYFAVPLGSLNPFGTSVNWNDDTLWLSMNIAGSNSACTSFGQGVCAGDGEMVPMKRLTAVPLAINSSMLGGKTAEQFVQLGQGTQTDSGDKSSISINKTGTGNFLDLQNNSNSVLAITNNGSLLFGSGSDKSISIADADAGNAGQNITISSGAGGAGSGSSGGDVIITGGDAGGDSAAGGNISINAGTGTGTSGSGTISIGTESASRVIIGQESGGSEIALNGSTRITQETDSEDAFVVASSLHSDVFVVDTLNGRVGVGQNSGSPDYALDVNGDINTSGDYRIDGNVVLTNSKLSFGGSDDAIIESASGHSLAFQSDTGVSVEVDGHDSITISRTSVQIGDGSGTGTVTLLTLDSSATAPGSATPGSMYYDTTLGKIQCYQADGWGDCSDNPDSFVTLSPEFSGAVINGLGEGEMSSNFCSDDLDVNNGSSNQDEVCGDKETYNYYSWTTDQTSSQTRSIYVNYQLPDNFKQFVPGTTSLLGRTDSSDAEVSYQIYRNSSQSGLTACGSVVEASSGAQSTWQKASATGNADPSDCGFQAGDSVVIKISLSAESSSNAYVSNLSFTISNS